MLIEFSVTNFLSLRDQQTLSLVKAKGSELQASNTFRVDTINQLHLLRSAAIYGPNAGGKSNFLTALRSMKEIVVTSAKGQQRGDKLPVTPFLLSQVTGQEPTEFEVTFIVDRVRYQYGFTCTAERVHEEWLFAYPKGRAQAWFQRAWNAKDKTYRWSFSQFLSGEKQLWQKSTRGNALFLSTAVQLNSDQLEPIFDWFSQRLHLTGVEDWHGGFSATLCEGNQKSQVMDFLKAADLGIEDIAVKREPITSNTFPDDMPEAVKTDLLAKLKGQEHQKVRTFHKTAEGNTIAFDFADESQGTQKLFAFAGPWLDSLAKGNVLFIDELHDNLHPNLVRFLVGLFHSKETNPHNAQLVFTTHETSILDQKVFRRDQIWFCEKDAGQATTLYPLTDFSPRKGRENLELAYLSGRYGALPYTRSLTESA